jgi:hypothetical protein
LFRIRNAQKRLIHPLEELETYRQIFGPSFNPGESHFQGLYGWLTQALSLICPLFSLDGPG